MSASSSANRAANITAQVVLPGVMRLLDPKPGKRSSTSPAGRACYAACSHQRGAEVTGCRRGADAHPRARASAGRRRFATTSPMPASLEFLPADHFDAAACVLAIQNIQPDRSRSSRRVARRSSRAAARDRDDAPLLSRAEGNELGLGRDDRSSVPPGRSLSLPRKTPIVTHPGEARTVHWTFHKPIEAYVKAMRNAGLLIDALEEWPSHKTSTSGPRAARKTSRGRRSRCSWRSAIPHARCSSATLMNLLLVPVKVHCAGPALHVQSPCSAAMCRTLSVFQDRTCVPVI